MSGQLSSFVSPITGPLGDLQTHFSQFASLHRDAHTRLFAQGNNLTQAGGLDQFSGYGSQSFTDAVQQYMSASEQTLQLLEQAGQAAQTCVNDIMGAVYAAESAALDLGIVSYILERTAIEDVLQIGADAIMSIIRDMVDAAVDVGSFLGRMILWTFGEVVHLIEQGKNVVELMAHCAWMLMEDIARVLSEWAEGIQGAVKTCQGIIVGIRNEFSYKSPHYITKLNQVQQKFLDDPNDKTLAAFIEQQENSDMPVAITRFPNSNTAVVTLAGMDPSHLFEITNFLTAIEAGAGDANNPYARSIESLLQGLPPGTHIIFAGHSLGGIEAQYVAESSEMTKYKIDDVITFGSPWVTPQIPGVTYQRYSNLYDVVPLLSWYNLGPILQPSLLSGGLLSEGAAALSTIDRVNYGNPQLKAQFIRETVLPDNTNLDLGKAHIYGGDQSLQEISIPVPKGSNISWPQGKTQFYFAGPQNPDVSLDRFSLQLGLDNFLPAISGLPPLSIP